MIIGTETEFGVLEPESLQSSAIEMSVAVALAVREDSRKTLPEAMPVTWDYGFEDPLNDMRGHRLERASARASQLTDSAESWADESVPTGVLQQAATPGATAAVLENGARFYVDHAHPEYSTPECDGPREAALYDRAGEFIAREAMQKIAERGRKIVLYKNNTDSKGAAYGSHENYLIPRSIDFEVFNEWLVPFFITRPIFCGAGRVGLGQRSSEAGFQISQRADFIESPIGLQTTFERPIVNTRDEPHASGSWRRLHVINGDANQFDGSNYLKLASTAVLLWYITGDDAGRRIPVELQLAEDPVELVKTVSRDISLQAKFKCADGGKRSALEWQKSLVKLIEGEVHKDDPQWIRDALKYWSETLQMLTEAPQRAVKRVEWLAKLQLLEQLRSRLGGSWDHPKLQALDIQWADLRTEHSVIAKLDAKGMVERLFTPAEVQQAAANAPKNTRAYWRGQAVKSMEKLVAAGWDSLLVLAGEEDLKRLRLGDPHEVLPLETLRARYGLLVSGLGENMEGK